MKIENMKDLYEELLRASSKGFGGRTITNPAVDFTQRAKSGEYDDVSEEEYFKELDRIEELNNVWQHRSARQVGELLLTALENVDLSESDVVDMAATLMCAYERTDQTHIPCDADAGQHLSNAIFGRGVRKCTYAGDEYEMCDDTGDKEIEYDISEEKERILSSPAGIYEYLDKNVYGQKEAKKAAAMLLWNHVNGRRQNVLFAGPTGCGKTEIFRQLSKLYPNIVVHNATSLTGTGWKGNMKVRNLFDGVDPQEMEHMIIVLDEADKMFEDADDRHYSYIVQNELLKLMEGDMVHFEGNLRDNEPTLDIDTSNVSFVFLGSFDSMVRAKDTDVNKSRAIGFGAESENGSFDGYESTFTQEDLVKYANVRSEIAGRIGSIVQLRQMSESDFYSILNSDKISPVNRLSDYYGVKVKMSARAKHKLAREAADNNMGVRYMKSRLQKMLDEMLFNDCGKQEYRIG